MLRPAVHLLSDGSVRVSDGYVNYVGPAAEFLLDFGEDAPTRPAGIDEVIYEQDRRHAYCKLDIGVVDGGPLPWTKGEELIPKVPAAIASQTARRELEAETKDKARVAKFRADLETKQAQRLEDQRQKAEAAKLPSWWDTGKPGG